MLFWISTSPRGRLDKILSTLDIKKLRDLPTKYERKIELENTNPNNRYDWRDKADGKKSPFIMTVLVYI